MVGFTALEVQEDVERYHNDWGRPDIIIERRTLTDISVESSTPSYDADPPVAIAGVFEIPSAALGQEIFGGFENIDAMLLLLPAVNVALTDKITVDTKDYRITEIKLSAKNGTIVQKILKLKVL